MENHGNGYSNGNHTGTARDLAAILFRRRRLIGLSFAGMFLGVVLVAVVFVANHYEAHLKVMVNHERSDAVVTPEPGNQVQLSSEAVTEEELNSEAELIKSRDSLEKVVAATGLDQKKSISDYLPFAKHDDRTRIAKAALRLSKDLTVEQLKKTHLIEVTYPSSDPELAASVLTSLSKLYLEKHVEVHRPAGTLNFFEQETRSYQKGLQDAEEKLASFSQQTRGVSAPLARDIAVQKLAEFNATLLTTKSAITETEQRIKDLETQLKATPARSSTMDHTTDPYLLLQTDKSTLLTLELKRTELLTKFDPSYPLVQEVDKEIAETKAAIAEAEKAPTRDQATDRDPTWELLREELAKAKADLATLKGREAGTAAAVRNYQQSTVQLDQTALAQQDLLRQAKADEENYLLYLHKQEEARISNALDNRRIVNVAVAEAPTVPALPAISPWLFALLGGLLSAAVSLVLAFAAEYFDTSLRTPDQVREVLDVPVFASIPKNGN